MSLKSATAISCLDVPVPKSLSFLTDKSIFADWSRETYVPSQSLEIVVYPTFTAVDLLAQIDRFIWLK